MIDIEITKMSAKGQIVIPSEMRQNIKEGEKLVIIKSGKHIILEKMNDFSKKVEEDILFAKRTEKALKRIQEGKGKKMEFDALLEEMKQW